MTLLVVLRSLLKRHWPLKGNGTQKANAYKTKTRKWGRWPLTLYWILKKNKQRGCDEVILYRRQGPLAGLMLQCKRFHMDGKQGAYLFPIWLECVTNSPLHWFQTSFFPSTNFKKRAVFPRFLCIKWKFGSNKHNGKERLKISVIFLLWNCGIIGIWYSEKVEPTKIGNVINYSLL